MHADGVCTVVQSVVCQSGCFRIARIYTLHSRLMKSFSSFLIRADDEEDVEGELFVRLHQI